MLSRGVRTGGSLATKTASVFLSISGRRRWSEYVIEAERVRPESALSATNGWAARIARGVHIFFNSQTHIAPRRSGHPFVDKLAEWELVSGVILFTVSCVLPIEKTLLQSPLSSSSPAPQSIRQPSPPNHWTCGPTGLRQNEDAGTR